MSEWQIFLKVIGIIVSYVTVYLFIIYINLKMETFTQNIIQVKNLWFMNKVLYR